MSTLNRIDESAINTSFYTLIGPSRSEEILVETLIGKVYSEKVCVIAYHCLRFTSNEGHASILCFMCLMRQNVLSVLLQDHMVILGA